MQEAGRRQETGASGPLEGLATGPLSTGPEQGGPQGLTPAALLPLWGHVAPDMAVHPGLGTDFEVPLCPNPQQGSGTLATWEAILASGGGRGSCHLLCCSPSFYPNLFRV